MTTETPLAQLKSRLATIYDLQAAAGLLIWDQQTNMPCGGTPARAEALATLSSLVHKQLTDDDMRRLLETVDAKTDASSVEGALIRLARRDFDQATKLPVKLVAEIARATSLAEPAWVAARKESDFSKFAPHLAQLVKLNKQVAEHTGYQSHPYDALLDIHEPGAKTLEIGDFFAKLKQPLVDLTAQIAHQSDAQDAKKRAAPLFGDFDEAKQEAFGREVIKRFGYDFTRGRQDRAVHPFCIGFGSGDVRITTRFDKGWLQPALFGTLHEAGHALYEQGIDPAFERTPMASGASMSIHESQSRLWENVVGRSRGFWNHFYKPLQQVFPAQLERVSLEDFYRAINTVERTPIRVEADEVTYNLHVLLRFELEVALFENNLKVEDLPAAWNEKMQAYLGLTPTNDAEGVLQDVHWSNGMFGYFPTYSLGNVLAVQLYAAALEAAPSIPEEIANGEFGSLHRWLTENIHTHGKRFEPKELIKRATTGSTLDTAPYLKYLKDKFGELYDLK